MPKEERTKDRSMLIAIIGLVGTLIAALLGSPVLVELLRNNQGTETPTAVVTQPPGSTESVVTQTPALTEQVLIFQENFDNDNVSGFAFAGNWQVGKDKNNQVLESSGPGTATFGPSDFTNGVIEFRVKMQENSGNAMAAVNFRDNGQASYALTFSENQLVLGYRENNGPVQAFGSDTTRALVFENGAWYLIRIEVRGQQMIVFVDNNRIMSASDNRLRKGGLDFSVDTGMQAAFDDIRVWELK